MKENKEIDLVTLFKTVWSQRNKLIKWGMIGLVVGIVIAFSIPKQYTSTMKLAPEKNA